jgi:hypothetical protein
MAAEAVTAQVRQFGSTGEVMKKVAPLPHGVLDYVSAAQMMTAPYLLGFSNHKRATQCSLYSGAAILGLSLLTRYPLGAIKAIPFPVHGVVETLAAVGNIAAPWLYGFANNKAAKWTHIISGAATLGLVAMTDYRAAERPAAQRSAGRSTYQVSTAADYDQYSARPPYTHYGDEQEQIPMAAAR